MSQISPYNIRAMIPIDSVMFVDREREKRRIEAMISSDTPQSVSIIGERRIGKSSLAFRVYHKMKEMEKTLAVYLNCDGLSDLLNSKDKFFELLNKLFLEVLEDKPEIKALLGKESNTLFDTYTSFKTFIQNCGKRKGIKTIIFIDEFEHLPKNKFADNTFFSNLRAMADNPDNHMAFVTISKKELEKLAHQSITTSNFWNIFVVVIIGLLDQESIDKLRKYGFERDYFSLTEEEIKKIHYYAGYFPFFNQMVLDFLWNSKSHNEPMDWDNLEVEIFPHYKELWEGRSIKEQKLLKKLIYKNYLDDFALKEMRTRGIVSEENDSYFAFSDYFEDLIKNRFRINRKKVTFERILQYSVKILDIFKKIKEISGGKGN
ncbi:MAG: AAA family ATPase [Candidatus Aminicenantes bacterium]|nr:AAA family ATPase [Candidatus Aminicenantes bacterium]NIM82531.1 AAA family ATPase [Candidatus Aminicenantes bacterium]NIN21889.1 AAA family ATPase [Candidatus Aminicenantes bacterium]NIN45667.1 AAA family ATPase [Candidatus Aminicenantes bacterium]NIN88500.1 AAA family ATPase [Candidatus Aminicenantes bacterium]